jgi:hypothetical protein
VRLRYLSLFATRGRLGDSGDLSSTRGFDALGCRGTGCVFGFAQSAPHG